MGTQVNFFMLSHDLREFGEFVFRKGDVVAIPGMSNSPSIRPDEGSANLERDFGSLMVYLLRTEDLACLNIRKSGATEEWVVDDLRSPAVQLLRSSFDGMYLRRGRLYYESGYYDDERQWQSKSTGFVQWAQSLVRWIKRRYVKDPQTGVYVGSHAWAWHLKEGGHLNT